MPVKGDPGDRGELVVQKVLFTAEQGVGGAQLQSLQGILAAQQRRLLSAGERFPVDVEGRVEGAGLAVARQGHDDPIVPGAETAVLQRPVHFQGLVSFFLGSGSGEACVQGDKIRIVGNGRKRFPLLTVPALQGGIRNAKRIRNPAESFLNFQQQRAACGGDVGNGGRDAPVRVCVTLWQCRRGEAFRRLPAALNEVGFRVLPLVHRVCAQADGHKGNGENAQKAGPEGGLFVAEHGFDPVFHADLAKGHGAGGIVDFAGAAVQKSGGIGLSLRQIHELHHPLIAGHFNILAQKHIADPDQRIEPVQHQGQKADELDPVVPLVQMGPLVGQDLLPGVLADPGGDVNLRFQKAQYKGGVQPLAFPAAPDLPGVFHLTAQMDVGAQTYQHQNQGDGRPQGQKKFLRCLAVGQGDGGRL